MAAGDYLIRRNASNTDTIPNTGSSLLTLWDTAVDNQGSGITYSSGTFTLGETGRFLVLCSDQAGTTATTNNERLNWKMTLNLDGTELVEGFSTGYIRKSNGSLEALLFSAGVIEVSSTTGTGDELEIYLERIDDTVGVGEEPDRIGDRSGITILKLDDDWNYGRYTSSALITPSATDGAATVMNLQTEVEEDSPFTRTTNTIDVATTNLVLAVYSIKSETSTANIRQEIQSRLTLGGTVVPGSYAQTYIRNTDTSDWGGMSCVCLLEPTSGQDVELEIVSREAASSTDYEGALQLVELPSGAEAAIMEATTGDFNTAATDFTWDTLPLEGTDFTATAGNANIDVDTAGDYLTMASVACLTFTAATRAVPALAFSVNTTDIEIAGNSCYNRNSGTAGFAALATAGLLTDLSADDEIYATNDRLGTATTTIANESGAFSVIRLSSLFPTASDPVITNADDEEFETNETNITVTGTDFGSTEGTLELGSSATYATATKVTQSIDSWGDTSIQFDLTLGGLTTQTDLWLYVTIDGGSTPSNAYQVEILRTPTITNIEDETFDYDETGIVLDGTFFLTPQSTGKVELADSATYATATKAAQTIDTWGASQITFDIALGALDGDTTLYVFVTNSQGKVSTGTTVTIEYPTPSISSVDTPIRFSKEDVDITGTGFGNTQGSGDVEMSNNSTYGSGTLVSQDIVTWADGNIRIDIVQGTLSLGTNYLFVTNNYGETSLAYTITVLEALPGGLYKTSAVVGTLTNKGFSTTIFLLSDE